MFDYIMAVLAAFLFILSDLTRIISGMILARWKRVMQAANIKYVLIVDDNPDISEVVKIILSKAGYRAKTMEHFEPFPEQEAPDVILLDLKMADQDGAKICRQLKKKKDTRNIPVILFSASPDVQAEALKAGADDFISKPFEINELLQKIEHVI